MYGLIEDRMIERLRALIAGKTVWALGSGPDTQEAWQLLEFGATEVHAVDKSNRSNIIGPRFARLYTGEKLGVFVDCQAYFTEFEEYAGRQGLRCPDIAFVKWPPLSTTVGLPQLIARARLVIYIGLNDGSTACGNSPLWRHFRGRELEEAIEGRRNDMLVYGAKCQPAKDPRCREERNIGDRW